MEQLCDLWRDIVTQFDETMIHNLAEEYELDISFLEYEVPDHIGAEIFAELVQFVIEELMPLDEEKAYDILKSAEISESTIRNLLDNY